MPTVLPRSFRRPSLYLVLGLVLTACATSGGLGPVPSTPATAVPSAESNAPDVTPAPSIAPSASASASASAGASVSLPPASAGPTPSASTPAATMIVRAYYDLAKDPGGLVPTLRVVPKTTGVARAAMEALLDADSVHRTSPQIETRIPEGTTLLGVAVKDGIATVDLSREFGTGSGDFRTRLGQVVYTLTQFSTVHAVAFQVEGQTLTSFGPEGIVIDAPLDRHDLESTLPSIFVDRPAFGAAAASPVRVRGNANVFEATFRIAILDGAGRQLVDQQAMATCGTGCRGTFDVTVRYQVAKAQWGTLRVYFGSAVDGSPQDIRDYPVWLTPAS